MWGSFLSGGCSGAQVLVELADLQDQEVGDGTTSVVILAAELLKRANNLITTKIHPTSIMSGYKLAMKEVIMSTVDNSLPVEINRLETHTSNTKSRVFATVDSLKIHKNMELYLHVCIGTVLTLSDPRKKVLD